MAAGIADLQFEERLPLEGDWEEGDFVFVNDRGNKKYGVLRSCYHNGKIDMLDFTDAKGNEGDFSDFACKYKDSMKRIVPDILGLEVRVKSCPEDEINAKISEDKDGNLILISKQKNDLVDNFFIQGHKYSCILLDKKERREMEKAVFGRVRSALSYLREKNFGYRFIADK